MNLFNNTSFSLSQRTALVTGAGRGLGKEIARLFAKAGADLMLCSRTETQLRDTAREIADETGARIEFITADLSKRDDAERLAKTAVERLGKVDILISNAGYNIPQTIELKADEDWDYLLELNVSSSMVLTRALAPGMMERSWGRIVYTSSILAMGSVTDRVTYSTTKAALLGLVKANSLYLGPHGITVNCIAPGPFATEMPMTLLTDEQKQSLGGRTALKRWGQPAELAPAALLLSSDAGAYITGTVLVIDGGATARVF
ncbi:MAG: SDR family oxidoreductase [Candidatus Omnitrophica bacterium]|nr:SDR family oxidoreductase [Candidatus Omnitrophota bacterium]